MSRHARRIAGLATLALALALFVPIALRIAAALREREAPRAIAPRDGSYVRADGLDLYRQELGDPRAPPVVLVHGTMAWSGTYRDLMERLAAAGFRAIAIDLPPFGFSERPDDHDYSRAAQARRIRALFDALDLRHAALVGHSFGGGATIEAAMLLGDRVDRLALLDVALGLEETEPSSPPLAAMWTIPPVREAMVASTFTNPWTISTGLRDFVYDDAIVTPERVAIYARPLAAAGTTDAIARWVLTGLYHDERGAPSQTPSAYRAYRAPVLVLWGREDTVTPLAQGEHIASLFPRAELVVLDRVSHIPHVEDVERVAAHLVRFLRAPR